MTGSSKPASSDSTLSTSTGIRAAADDSTLMSRMSTIGMPTGLMEDIPPFQARKAPKRFPRKAYSRPRPKSLNLARMSQVYQNPRIYWPTFIGGVCLFFLTIAFQDDNIFEILQRNLQSLKSTPMIEYDGPRVPPLPPRCTGVCCSPAISVPVLRNPVVRNTYMVSTVWDTNLFEGSKVPTPHQINCGLSLTYIQILTYHDTWWGINASDPNSLSCNKKSSDMSPLGASPSTFTVIRAGPAAVRLLTSSGRYVVALENGRMGASEGGASLGTVFVVQRLLKDRAGDSIPEFQLRTRDLTFVGCKDSGQLAHWSKTPQAWESFRVLQVTHLPAWRGVNLGGWLVLEDWMTPDLVAGGTPGGGGGGGEKQEWKLMQRVGPKAAQGLLESHYRKFVSKADFHFMATRGMNAVRVPVGWWVGHVGLMSEPKDFLEGQVAHLDRAFDYCRLYRMGIFLSIHAAPGPEMSSQLEKEVEWGRFPEIVAQVVESVEWLAKRYASHKSFLGISLLNEPMGVGLPLPLLKNYYLEAYKAVRKHSPCAFVGIAPRHKGSLDDLEGFMADKKYNNVLLDLHAYVAHDPQLDGKSVQQCVEHVRDVVGAQIKRLQEGGRQVVVGEWALAMKNVEGVGDREMEELGVTQLEVYSRASAGWFFWSHRIGRTGWPHWSFKESVTRGWLPFKIGARRR